MRRFCFRQVGEGDLLHQCNDKLAHSYPFGVYRARRTVVATIAPENAPIENIAALDCRKNVGHRDGLWVAGESVAANSAARRTQDLRPLELLKYFRQKICRYLRRFRNVSQLNGHLE